MKIILNLIHLSLLIERGVSSGGEDEAGVEEAFGHTDFFFMLDEVLYLVPILK